MSSQPKPDDGAGVDRRPGATVTLLTQDQCGLCDQAKAVLRRIQNDPAVAVRVDVLEVDLASAEGQRLGADAGVLFAPAVLLDGEPFAHGRLSERKLRRALARWSSCVAADAGSGLRP